MMKVDKAVKIVFQVCTKCHVNRRSMSLDPRIYWDPFPKHCLECGELLQKRELTFPVLEEECLREHYGHHFEFFSDHRPISGWNLLDPAHREYELQTLMMEKLLQTEQIKPREQGSICLVCGRYDSSEVRV